MDIHKNHMYVNKMPKRFPTLFAARLPMSVASQPGGLVNVPKKKTLLECTVCLDAFSHNQEIKQPRLMACGHSLCTACLQKQPKPNGAWATVRDTVFMMGLKVSRIVCVRMRVGVRPFVVQTFWSVACVGKRRPFPTRMPCPSTHH